MRQSYPKGTRGKGSMLDSEEHQVKPYWVVLQWSRLFIAGFDTCAAAQVYARHLNHVAPAPPGLPPHYVAIPRPPDTLWQRPKGSPSRRTRA